MTKRADLDLKQLFVKVSIVVLSMWIAFAIMVAALVFAGESAWVSKLAGTFAIVDSLFGSLGLIGVAVALLIQFQTTEQARYLQLLAANNARIAELESTLATTPTALRFHGLDAKDIEAIGLTVEEFVYLLNSFTYSGTYYRIMHPDDRNPFEEGTYRYNICASEHTRKAWPLIRRMMQPSTYRDKVDATIALVEESIKKQHA